MKTLPAAHHIYRWIALAAAAVMVLRLGAGMFVFNHTIDEPAHLGSAIALYDVGKHVLNADHPPLARLVAGLPLWLQGVRLADEDRTTSVRKVDAAFAAGTRLLHDDRLGYWRVLNTARGAMLIFPCVALMYVWLLGRWLVDERVAMLATVFFSLDPTLLGHGLWVTTDTSALVGYLAAIYHGLRWMTRPTRATALALGAALGIAAGAKFSTVAALPALLIMLLIGWRAFVAMMRQRHADRVLRPLIVHSLIIALGAIVVLWAIYLFNIGRIGNSDILASHPAWQRVPEWMKQPPVPMPSLPLGLVRQMGHAREGHTSYLLGEVRDGGWWYYFPLMFIVKTPVATLAALAAAVVAWVLALRTALRCIRDDTSARAIGLLLLTPAIVFLAMCMMGRINIGIRHLLPAVPFVYLFIAWSLTRVRLDMVLLVLMLIAGIETARVHPDYIAYHNFAAGGAENGTRYSVDSNLDWGQDTWRLAQWLHSPAAEGREYTIRLSGGRQAPLLAELGLDPAALEREPGGLLAINKRRRLLELQDEFGWLDSVPPMHRIGYSIDVYDLDALRDNRGD
jgi:dolichyl-phosphate-mannose--protein O-mannosyl transferase